MLCPRWTAVTMTERGPKSETSESDLGPAGAVLLQMQVVCRRVGYDRGRGFRRAAVPEAPSCRLGRANLQVASVRWNVVPVASSWQHWRQHLILRAWPGPADLTSLGVTRTGLNHDSVEIAGVDVPSWVM